MKIDKEKTKPHWLEVDNKTDGWGMDFAVVWDGCVNIRQYQPPPNADMPNVPDVLHVCELADFIDDLIELHGIAVEHFDEEREWPAWTWVKRPESG